MKNNYVAKHLHKTCKAVRMRDRKNDYSRKGKNKLSYKEYI